MTKLAADRWFAAGPDVLRDVVTEAADVLFGSAWTDAEGSVRYSTRRGLYSPGAVVEVSTVAAAGGCGVRVVASVGRSLFGRTRGEQCRLNLLLDAVGQVLESDRTRDEAEPTEAPQPVGATSIERVENGLVR